MVCDDLAARAGIIGTTFGQKALVHKSYTYNIYDMYMCTHMCMCMHMLIYMSWRTKTNPHCLIVRRCISPAPL